MKKPKLFCNIIFLWLRWLDLGFRGDFVCHGEKYEKYRLTFGTLMILTNLVSKHITGSLAANTQNSLTYRMQISVQSAN
jgi:hypothetical protein